MLFKNSVESETSDQRIEIYKWSFYFSGTITLDVRTNAINGFLFHVADARQIDKEFAYLKDGYVYFGFDYGSGSVVLKSNIQINDGEWHEVSVCAEFLRVVSWVHFDK